MKHIADLKLTKSIKKSSKKLRLYDGSLMRPAGKINIRCSRGKKRFNADFIVVNQNTQPIIGLKTALAQKFISIASVN